MFDVSNMNITADEVYDAVRRGYTDLADSTDLEIVDYFDGMVGSELVGHISNIKGITLEMELARELDGELFELTNHVGTDIIIDDVEYSVKSGISIQATNEDLEEGLDVIATTEIADVTDAIDAGISNVDLTSSVTDYLELLM